MDTIIKYLKNPMHIGVYNCVAIVDFSKIPTYFGELIADLKNQDVKGTLGPILLQKRISSLEEALKKLTEERQNSIGSEVFFDKLMKAFYVLSLNSKQCPENIRKIFLKERDAGDRKICHPVGNIFRSHLIPELSDVILIDKRPISKNKWLFDYVTIKEKSIRDFKEKLEAIPTLKENMETKKERHHFSTRYVFRPYPLAVQLLLDDKLSIAIPYDLKSFLSGAISYIFSGEWRTSIVLSAIAIESVLADLYEENNKEPAPDTPLGDLFKRVEAKWKFPSDIAKAIEMANSARIAAVHRSRLPVSDREAINALFGQLTSFSGIIHKVEASPIILAFCSSE